MSDEPKWHVVDKLFSTHRPGAIHSWVWQHPPEGHKAVAELIGGLDYNCCCAVFPLFSIYSGGWSSKRRIRSGLYVTRGGEPLWWTTVSGYMDGLLNRPIRGRPWGLRGQRAPDRRISPSTVGTNYWCSAQIAALENENLQQSVAERCKATTKRHKITREAKC